MYFDRFPYIKYQFPDNNVRFYKNLSIRPAIIERVKEYEQNLQPYYVKEGELPDHIAYDFYGRSNLHWIVMLANDVLNLHTDWPKTTQQFKAYLTEKYKDQVTNQDREIVLTELELQRFVEFEGTIHNKFTSYVIIDSERNGFVRDSEGALSDSDEYIVIQPWKLRWEPKDPIYPDVRFEDRYIKPNVWSSRENAFGYYNTFEGNLFPISFYEYEFEENEDKRKIRLPRNEVIEQILDEFPELVRQ